MVLTILRKYNEKSTSGRLLINGGFYCHTLELPKFRCIPEGEYAVHMTYSPRFKRIVPQIMNVPGRTGIRIHWGNFVKDTQGCPLVGYDAGKDANGVEAVFRSKVCFEEFNRWLIHANKDQVIAIEIKADAQL